MTPNELRNYFNTKYGMNEPWPDKFKVDADTYAQVCQEIFNHVVDGIDRPFITIAIGPNNGIMFKNVELILEILPE